MEKYQHQPIELFVGFVFSDCGVWNFLTMDLLRIEFLSRQEKTKGRKQRCQESLFWRIGFDMMLAGLDQNAMTKRMAFTTH
jgi:hypothetical protein